MDNLENITQHFSLRSELEGYRFLKIGNVHTTWFLECKGGVSYVLQKINDRIFNEPAQLVENMNHVCKHLAKNPLSGYRDLYLVPTHQGSCFHVDEQGSFWRCLPYITQSRVLNNSRDPRIIKEAARAFALFLRRLDNFPLPYPQAPIANFHDAELRFKQLENACHEDKFDRKKDCRAEIDFFFSHETEFKRITRMVKKGELPLRLCHNDTKLNNVLFALNRNEVLSVIDLDTVMAGTILYDFGDFVRSCGSGYPEDTVDRENASLKMPLYEAAIQGFFEGYSPLFTAQEYSLLPESIRVMSFIIGSRFLSDYLNGDCYFRTAFPGHNLVRTRNQISFIQSLVKQFNLMLSCLEKIERSV